MWTPEYYVRLVELPPTVEGVTIPNDDGTFEIYLNSLLCETRRAECLEHEIRHIKKDHFYNDIQPIEEIECEADGLSVQNPTIERKSQPPRLPDVIFSHPAGKIAVFNSLDSLGRYLFALKEQYHRDHAAGER